MIDGDTIVVKLEGEAEKVSSIGVGAPESVHPTKPVERHGKEASIVLSNNLLGNRVYLDREQTSRDRNGREHPSSYRRKVFRACDEEGAVAGLSKI